MFINNNEINYQITVLLTSLSESIFNIVLTWLMYNYTHDPIAISMIAVNNYLPMILSIIIFIFIADLINPLYQYCINNILFFIITLSIFLIFKLKLSGIKFVIINSILQIIYSIIRTTNKINSNKILELIFENKSSKKTLQTSFFINQLFQTTGTVIANLFIISNLAIYSFSLIIISYLICFFISYILMINNNEKYNLKKNNDNNLCNKKKYNPLIKDIFNKEFMKIMLFSIPSSGIYQYLNTMIPFLTKLMNIKSNITYSILIFFFSFSTTVISYLIYKNIINKKFIERYTFLICFINLLLLSYTNNLIMMLIFISICSSLLTAHILYMQMNINLNFGYNNLGKLTIIRNSVASFAKVIFSLMSAFLLKKLSFFYLYIIISFISLFFQILNNFFEIKLEE